MSMISILLAFSENSLSFVPVSECKSINYFSSDQMFLKLFLKNFFKS